MGSSAIASDPEPLSEPPPFLPSTKSDYLQGGDPSADEDDLSSRIKSLQRQLECNYIKQKHGKDKRKKLKREVLRAQEEVKRIISTMNREFLKPSASVALHSHSNALVDVLPPEADSSISLLSQSEKPDFTYNVCIAEMNLGDEVDPEDYVSRPDKISAAEVCSYLIQ
ncbi:26S proteasome regulatory subunit 6B homolog [Gastrolobium bilobum]|uniref:26S proteasome regulatory subunit 6B homolog n=1 Tax=Gastrolobium bilobum TaxID=150636 RepID=UPI002AB09D4A|nr:26S proteasome regulatory subunit 6B homolog [Gastrolobium bilobum]